MEEDASANQGRVGILWPSSILRKFVIHASQAVFDK